MFFWDLIQFQSIVRVLDTYQNHRICCQATLETPENKKYSEISTTFK